MISQNSSVSALVLGFSRSASFLALILPIYFKRNISSPQFLFLTAISTALFFIINYPLSLPRYIMFSYILAVVYVYSAPTTFNKASVFMVFTVGITTVFPFLSFITRGRSDKFDVNMIDYYSSSGDFDGFQSTLNVVQYTIDQSFTYGHQLLGALLIFIPRSIWESKPIATGNLAAENMGYTFTNVSSPLVSELYVDFGYFGVTIIAFMLGWTMRKLDSYLLKARHWNNYAAIFMGAVVFSFSIIVLRGTLIGVIANVMLQLLLTVSILSFASKKISRIPATFN